MSQPSLDALRHAPAHVLAYAVQDLFPDAKPTIGPSIESGFYYDFDRATPFTPDDLAALEKRMHAIVKADYAMTCERVTREEAIQRYAGNEYNVELASNIPDGEPITLYTIGKFTDLYRGGHAERTSEIGAIKLMSVAGAYWHGLSDPARTRRLFSVSRRRRQARSSQAQSRTRPLSHRGRRRRGFVFRHPTVNIRCSGFAGGVLDVHSSLPHAVQL